MRVVSLMKRHWATMTLFIVAGLALSASACDYQGPVVDPIESRAQELDKMLMCPICPGESIDQSQIELANQMKGVVREKLAAGWTDEQVKVFFVERYGPRVLMEPPRSGFYIVAWVVPPIVVGVVMGFLYFGLRRLSAQRAMIGGGELEVNDGDGASIYIEQIRAAVEED